MPVKLGELLLKENMVSPQQLQEALNHQKMSGGKLGKAFVSLGFVKDEEITSLLSRQYGVPSINLDHFEVDPQIIKIIPAETARKYQVLPLSRSGATLTIAMADPTNVFAMDDIKFMTGYNVEPVVASESTLEEAIDKYYGSTRSLELRRDTAPAAGYGSPGGGPTIKEVLEGPTLSADDMAAIGGLSEIDLDAMSDADADVETVKAEDDEIDLGNLAKSADAAPVIKLTNVLMVDSLKRGASDIHIEPYEKEFRVRFRIDGVLYNVMALPMKLRDPLISRVKIMAKLDIAEKRLPQDGRIKIKMKVEDRSRDLDFRVSVLPTLWGEKIVMRLLDKTKLMLDMTKLGFEEHSLLRFKNAISKPYGIVLVTGPTGSGKTNTLYSAIASLNKPDTNIMTAEDPVEFNLPGINQVQIRDNIGLNFAAALRSFLRQDPNIILVGRDPRLRDGGDRGQGGPHRAPRALDTAHERRALHGLAHGEHGDRAVPGGHRGEPHPGPAPRAPRLQQVQAGRDGRSAVEDADRHRLHPGPGRQLPGPEGQGLRHLQRHRLQGTGGPLRGHGDHRGDPRPHHGRGDRGRDQEEGAGGGDADPPQSGLEKIKNGVTTVEEVLRETVL